MRITWGFDYARLVRKVSVTLQPAQGGQGNVLLRRSAFGKRNQVGHGPLPIDRDYQKHLITALNDNSLANRRKRHTGT